MFNLRKYFLLDPSVAFLNHGSFGATPKPVFNEYQRWQRELENQPVEFLGRRFTGLMAESRAVLGEYLGTHADNLVYTQYEKLSGNKMSETSEVISQRVQAARERQRIRFSNNGSSDIVSNADMRIGEIRQFCKLQDESQSLMRSAMSQLQLSARLSSYPETRAYDCGSGGERRNPIHPSGGGAAIPSEDYDRIRVFSTIKRRF